MKKINKTQIAAGLLIVLIAAGAAAGYSGIFTTGAGVADEAPSGLYVTASVDHDDSDINPVRDNNTIYIADTYFNSSADTSVTVDQFAGTTTQLSSIDATNGTIEVNPGDKSAIKIDGAVTELHFEDAALDGTAQITHSSSGSGTITATGLPASTGYAAATTSGEVLTTGTTTSGGEASISVDAATGEQIVLLEPSAAEASNLSPDGTETNNENVGLSFDLADQDFATDAGDSVDVDLVVDGTTVNSWTGVTSNQTLSNTVNGLGDGDHNWHVETTDSFGETSTSSTATFTVNHYAPEFSNANPADGAQLSARDQTFEIQVNDTDFAEPSGDTVNVSLYIDSKYIDSDTLTANGTASVTTTLSDGGSHDYYWIGEDEYGNTTTSATRTIEVPSTLELRKESDPNTLVTDATVNITAYYSGEVMRRNTTDGTLNLTDFPVDQPLTIRAQADGYYTRTVVIESIYEQSNAYLLNDSGAAYPVRFQLQESVDYPEADTVLFVERDLKLNNSTEWRVITGDNFGIVGVPTDLVQDERYRLRIKNLNTGETAVLGKYTAIQSETVTLSPRSATVDITESESAYAWEVTENESAPALIFEYLDTANQTDSVTINVHERYNKSNVLFNNQTFSSNELVYQYSMTQDESNKTWMAEIYVDRGNGTMHFSEPVMSGPNNIIPINLDKAWRTGISVFVMLVAGMAFSMLHVGVGAIATSLIGGMLWYLGLLTGVATAPAIGMAITVSFLYHYYQGGGY